MQSRRIQILSTRPVDQSLIQSAEACGIDIEIISFIETEPISEETITNKIEALASEKITTVFTSMNAVEAVVTATKTSPHWQIGSLGTTTYKLIKKHFPGSSVIATGNNASELAHALSSIVRKGKVIFFCGDQRRDELPSILKEHGIEVEEIIVYKTIAQPIHIDKDYDGIAFYSPSAVHSFFSVNKLNKSAILFSIGSTTSESVRQYTNNTIIEAGEPGKENLIKKILDYYTTTQKPVNS
jgi:uroporphyrinogen-III synthase